MLVIPFQILSSGRKWAALALYHFGRISIYALMGVILYSFKSVFNPHIQQYVSIIIGALLLIAGILSFLPNTGFRNKLPWSGYVQKKIGRFMVKPSLYGLFLAGVLNGLLPCGLVYMALAASVNAAAPIDAALSMYAFGIGTMPMLVGITIFKSRLRLQYSTLKKMVPAVMLFFGCLFILRGLNLGIPYLSPKVEVTAHHEVKANCCHKK
jgi:sulfite exporter TauE/SafE